MILLVLLAGAVMVFAAGALLGLVLARPAEPLAEVRTLPARPAHHPRRSRGHLNLVHSHHAYDWERDGGGAA